VNVMQVAKLIEGGEPPADAKRSLEESGHSLGLRSLASASGLLCP